MAWKISFTQGGTMRRRLSLFDEDPDAPGQPGEALDTTGWEWRAALSRHGTTVQHRGCDVVDAAVLAVVILCCLIATERRRR